MTTHTSRIQRGKGSLEVSVIGHFVADDEMEQRPADWADTVP